MKIFYSPVGNSSVPYPFAVGDKYVYLISDEKFVDRNKFKIDVDKSTDLYSPYYDFDKHPSLENEAIPMKNYKLIQERL